MRLAGSWLYLAGSWRFRDANPCGIAASIYQDERELITYEIKFAVYMLYEGPILACEISWKLVVFWQVGGVPLHMVLLL